jgi:hypothetical protein
MSLVQVASMTRRLLAVLIVVTCVPIAACATGPAEPNPDAAIQVALVASGFADSAQIFPRQPGEIACTVHGGGPAPGMSLPGTCQTSAAWNGIRFLVTFTEHWDATAFHAGDVDPASGQLSYSWRYSVDRAGHATFVSSWGNFPPQAAY